MPYRSTLPKRLEAVQLDHGRRPVHVVVQAGARQCGGLVQRGHHLADRLGRAARRQAHLDAQALRLRRGPPAHLDLGHGAERAQRPYEPATRNRGTVGRVDGHGHHVVHGVGGDGQDGGARVGDGGAQPAGAAGARVDRDDQGRIGGRRRDVGGDLAQAVGGRGDRRHDHVARLGHRPDGEVQPTRVVVQPVRQCQHVLGHVGVGVPRPQQQHVHRAGRREAVGQCRGQLQRPATVRHDVAGGHGQHDAGGRLVARPHHEQRHGRAAEHLVDGGVEGLGGVFDPAPAHDHQGGAFAGRHGPDPGGDAAGLGHHAGGGDPGLTQASFGLEGHVGRDAYGVGRGARRHDGDGHDVAVVDGGHRGRDREQGLQRCRSRDGQEDPGSDGCPRGRPPCHDDLPRLPRTRPDGAVR